MGERQHITQAFIVRHENSRFFGGAESARTLAGTRLPGDPVFGDYLLLEKSS
ncbi:MAG: hypothetical protein WD688_01010 [Candidatus Binatia bacterium]